MALEKTLETNSKVKSWNFDAFNTKGQRIGLKNSNGDYEPIITVESVKCSEGIVDRIVINKTLLREAGFTIIEE